MDEVWDETAKELNSNQISGGDGDSFEDCEQKIEIAPIFLMVVTDLNHEQPPAPTFPLCTYIHPPQQ